MPAIRATRHADLEAIEIVEARTRLVIVHEVGPRIAAFGAVGRENLLFWDEPGTHRRGNWRMYGGHRLWTARPGADESEETYAPDNARCVVRELGDGVEVTAPPTPSQLEKTLAVTVRGPTWTIEHRVRNAGDLIWRGGAWALTCTLPTPRTRYRIPLDGGSPSWDVLTMVIPRRWAGHTSRLDDPQFAIDEDALTVCSTGQEAKRMLLVPRGTLEMHDPDRGAFTKSAVLRRDGEYPLGTNVAVYLGPASFMVELETMSPFSTLAPGDQLTHAETWTMAADR